jgi:predicted PurR-regulated permease PerM
MRAVLLAFVLFLAYRFLASVATAVLLISAGLLLAVALSAPVEALHRRKVPRPVAVVLVLALVAGALALTGYLLLPELVRQATQLAMTLPEALARAAERLGRLAERLGIRFADGNVSTRTVANIARRLLGGALGLFTSLASLVTGVVVVLFVTVYLAAMPGPVVDWTVRLFPPERRGRTRELLDGVRESLLGWLGGRLFSMLVVGVLSTVALYVIGIPGALFLGIFSGLISFVPLIGSVAGVVPPFLIALAQNPIEALWVALAYVVIQQVESNLITPLVMQKAVSIHPVVVLGAVTVAGAAFGILGVLLAVPTAVVASVLIGELWFRRLEGGGEGEDERQENGEEG